MARQVEHKLRVTAALLGTTARKDLAAAFRRINASTSFEIGRAHKWMQGRSQPRELQLYEDWSKVLGLNRPGQWIADCDLETFVDEICARHGRNRDALLRELAIPVSRSAPGSAVELTGTFACYSHAWSPYFHGRLIRGALSVGPASKQSRLPISYTEILPIRPLTLKGSLHLNYRSMHGHVSDGTSAPQTLTFCLFQASPPASVLAGFIFGTTVMGPEAQPSSSRIVMARLPAATSRLRSADAYLPPQGSVAEDLASLGLLLEDPAGVDKHLGEFLDGGGGSCDQISRSAYSTLVDVFDRGWLSGGASSSHGAAHAELPPVIVESDT